MRGPKTTKHKNLTRIDHAANLELIRFGLLRNFRECGIPIPHALT